MLKYDAVHLGSSISVTFSSSFFLLLSKRILVCICRVCVWFACVLSTAHQLRYILHHFVWNTTVWMCIIFNAGHKHFVPVVCSAHTDLHHELHECRDKCTSKFSTNTPVPCNWNITKPVGVHDNPRNYRCNCRNWWWNTWYVVVMEK